MATMETPSRHRSQRSHGLLALVAPLALLALLAACSATEKEFERAERTKDPSVVERSIRVGMTAAEVEKALGRPSFVTPDDERHDEWTYHRYARAVETAPDGSCRILAFASVEAQRASRKRVSVIVTFGPDGKVYEISHRTRVVDYPVD